jgi:hypothetical protein
VTAARHRYTSEPVSNKSYEPEHWDTYKPIDLIGLWRSQQDSNLQPTE